MTTEKTFEFDFAPDKSRSITIGTNRCMHCGGKNHIMLYTTDLEKYANGDFIQDAFGYLNVHQRELIHTGIHESCWDEIFQKKA